MKATVTRKELYDFCYTLVTLTTGYNTVCRCKEDRSQGLGCKCADSPLLSFSVCHPQMMKAVKRNIV